MPFIYTEQGQRVSVLLAALYEMRGVNTKLQTIAHIEKADWLKLEPTDWQPYPNHQYESAWHTDIAFARQWCVDKEPPLMLRHDGRDMWEISPLGMERLVSVREKFRNGIYDVREGHLWAVPFKKWLRPDYDPSSDAIEDAYI